MSEDKSGEPLPIKSRNMTAMETSKAEPQTCSETEITHSQLSIPRSPIFSCQSNKVEQLSQINNSKLISKNNKFLRTITINARSLLPKINDLRALALTFTPSVIFITETWLDSSISDSNISLENYVPYRNDREKGVGGGVLLYINESLKSHNISILSSNSIEIVCAIICLTNNLRMLVGTIYRPPKFDSLTDKALHDLFITLSNNSSSFKFLSGDFNLPEVSWGTLMFPTRLTSFSTALQYGDWYQHVSMPTRGNNVLDLIFTSGIAKLKVSVGSCFPQSDHNIIYCCFPTTFDHKPFQKFDSVRRDWSKVDNLRAVTYIRSCDWNKFFSSDNLNECCEQFYINFHRCVNDLAPLKTRSSLNKKLPNYIPPNTRHKLRKLNRDFHLKKDISAYVRIKEIHEECEFNRIQRLKDEEVRIMATKNNTQELARLYKGRFSSNSLVSALIDNETNNLIENPYDIANAFSKYFSSCFLNDKANPIIFTNLNNNSNTFKAVCFTAEDIIKAINSLRSSTSLCPDNIPPRIIKLSVPDIVPILMKIFEISLNSGNYPDAWKVSYIRPRFKSGSRLGILNYRPINVTSILSRIMEKILKTHMFNFFLTENVLSPSQHGFLSKRSCATCQVDFLDHITSLRDKGYSAAVLYFDFSKAFDTVSHPRLLHKLEKYGIRDPVLKWISSFLSGRSQMVNIGDILSDPFPLNSGVIQGSVLGPLLFLIYINDITEGILNGCPYLYADDLKIVYKLDKFNTPRSISRIQNDLDKLEDWCNLWAMKLNVDKCGVMYIGNAEIKATLFLNKSPLHILKSVKDLGIIYNQYLSVSEQVSSVAAKANRSAGFIGRNFSMKETKLTLFKMFVRPKIEYCSYALSLANKADIVKLERVQRTFTRRIHNSVEHTPYLERCKLFNLDPLALRRVKLNLIFLYKYIHSEARPNAGLRFQSSPVYSLRNSSHKLQIPRHNRTLRARSFFIRYSIIWNRLPEYIRRADSVQTFKSKLSSFLNITTFDKLINPYHNKNNLSLIPKDL